MTTVLDIQAQESQRKVDAAARYVALLRVPELSAKEVKELVALTDQLGYGTRLLKVHLLAITEYDRLEKERQEQQALIDTTKKVEAELQAIKEKFEQMLLEVHEKIDPQWDDATKRQRQALEAMESKNGTDLQMSRLVSAFPFLGENPELPAADPLRIGLPPQLIDALAEAGVKLDQPERRRA